MFETSSRSSPGSAAGNPCIRGLRITVYDILDYLAAGMTPEEIRQDFPDLTEEDIRSSLKFAAEREHIGRIGASGSGDRPAGE